MLHYAMIMQAESWDSPIFDPIYLIYGHSSLGFTSISSDCEPVVTLAHDLTDHLGRLADGTCCPLLIMFMFLFLFLSCIRGVWGTYY